MLYFFLVEISSLKFDTRDRTLEREPYSERCSTYYCGCYEKDYFGHVGVTSIWSISSSYWGFMGTPLQAVGFFDDDWVCWSFMFNLFFFYVLWKITLLLCHGSFKKFLDFPLLKPVFSFSHSIINYKFVVSIHFMQLGLWASLNWRAMTYFIEVNFVLHQPISINILEVYLTLNGFLFLLQVYSKECWI